MTDIITERNILIMVLGESFILDIPSLLLFLEWISVVSDDGINIVVIVGTECRS